MSNGVPPLLYFVDRDPYISVCCDCPPVLGYLLPYIKSVIIRLALKDICLFPTLSKVLMTQYDLQSQASQDPLINPLPSVLASIGENYSIG
jgi:hypothetical protein